MESDDPFGNVEPYIPPPDPEGFKFFKATPFSWSEYIKKWRDDYIYRKANPPLEAQGGIVVDGLHIPEHGLHAKRGGIRWGEPTFDFRSIDLDKVQHWITSEIEWIFQDMVLYGSGGSEHISDLLFSENRPVLVDEEIYIEYPDGRMYVADLCTPIYDKLREESKWESDF